MSGFDESEFDPVTREEAAAAGVAPTPAPRPTGPTAPVQTGPVVTGTMEEIVANLLNPSPVTQGPQTAEESVAQVKDLYMQDVDKRLELAMVYREFLKGSMFDNGTEASRIAEFEMRGFVRERLGDLMNIQDPGRPKVQQLTEAEVEVVRSFASLTPEQILGLKMLADKFRTMTGPAPAPTIRQMSNPTAPATPPATPTLIRRQPPTSLPTTPAPIAPAPQQQAAPVPQRRPGPGRGHKGPQSTFRERVTSHPDGNGQSVEIVTRDVRRQRPAGMLPMPASNLEMEAATAMASARTAATVQANNPTLVPQAIVAINNTPTPDTE